MSVYDFLSLLNEDDAMVAIYDMWCEEEVFIGEAADAIDCDWCDYEILSFDLCDDDPRGVVMVLNIDTEEG